ncbi:MAG: PIN domain-containing protein [Candidatus Micrarchaeota archaeon]|nr:PIN domain-containing protein [Candidatus Micrarchaeota archaeon]
MLGDVVRKYVESDEQIYTPSISFMEIKTKFIHEGKEYLEYLNLIEERSTIINIDKNIALEAATVKSSNGLPSIDALVYACAKKVKTKLLTGDAHFEKISDVEFLKN